MIAGAYAYLFFVFFLILIMRVINSAWRIFSNYCYWKYINKINKLYFYVASYLPGLCIAAFLLFIAFSNLREKNNSVFSR